MRKYLQLLIVVTILFGLWILFLGLEDAEEPELAVDGIIIGAAIVSLVLLGKRTKTIRKRRPKG